MKKEEQSDAVKNFWNELAITQMASGKAPSVKTKEMKNALDGDIEAADKISKEIDINKAAMKGFIHLGK
jgi:hypothetical protein